MELPGFKGVWSLKIDWMASRQGNQRVLALGNFRYEDTKIDGTIIFRKEISSSWRNNHRRKFIWFLDWSFLCWLLRRSSHFLCTYGNFPNFLRCVYGGYLEPLVDFNSVVWKAKKDAGVSLAAPISGHKVPDSLKDIEQALVSMHKLE